MRTALCLIVASLLIIQPVFGQADNPSPESIPGAESRIYKSIGDTILLRLHIFKPSAKSASPRSAIIFYFGGGWTNGSVKQFVPHCKYFAERGIVTVVADYRVKSRHGVTPFECVADAKSAMRWLRTHAAEFNIDPDRIVAAGGSAGGHLAACTALIKGFDTSGDDLNISPAPNALVLFNPVVDMALFFQTRRNRSDMAEKINAISPIEHIRKGAPPTLIFHGTADKTVPIEQVTRFCDEMKRRGNECQLITFEGRGHGFFNTDKGDGSDYRATLEKMEAFLVRFNSK